ncbi:hypothetical protein BJV74DRAFT_890219 [Russula compacta]|nr:hypothetical protein BJV74DRAFT_890219 [Russula compacta]
MGGFENLDGDGNEIMDKKYPKYAEVKAEGKKGFQDVVKINMNKPAERLDTSGTLKNATKASSGLKTTFTNADLPPGCLSKWNELYVQLLHDWAGTTPNPWSCHDANIRANFQMLWDLAYPDIPTDIQPKQAIFVRSTQKIAEWRGLFGSGTVATLEKIWITKGIKTQEGRKRYANHMLGAKFPFVYLSFDSKKQKGSGIFQSELVLSTLALHFTATNALDDEVRSTEDPEGALLLSVVACEHALTQCTETGEIVLSTRKWDNHFSEEMWSEPTIWYQSPIRKLSPESWDLIIDGAWKISQEKKAGRVTLNCVDSKMPEADERELLAEGDEVVENDEIVWDSCEFFYHHTLANITNRNP